MTSSHLSTTLLLSIIRCINSKFDCCFLLYDEIAASITKTKRKVKSFKLEHAKLQPVHWSVQPMQVTLQVALQSSTLVGEGRSYKPS